MKIKFLITICIGLLFSSKSIAQNSRWEFGIKAGGNYSKYITPGVDFHERKPGFYLGGFSNFEITENLSVQPEILFSLQGSRLSIEDIEIRDPMEAPRVGSIKTNVNDYNILIPIMARYRPISKIVLEAGPQFGYTFNREQKIIESVVEDEIYLDFFNEDKNFEVALGIGLGYQLSKRLAINTRYSHSLQVSDFYDIKFSVLNLGLEYEL